MLESEGKWEFLGALRDYLMGDGELPPDWETRLAALLVEERWPDMEPGRGRIARLLANRCVQKLEPDEPFFVLLGRDACAAGAVREWARLRARDRGESPKTIGARIIAGDMDEFALKRANPEGAA